MKNLKGLTMKKKHIISITKILIGLLFITSGFAKVLESNEFAKSISNYGFGWAGFLAPIFSGTEIILGLCILLNIRPKQVSMLIGLMTIFFTLAFSYAFLFKNIKDCGCMGSYINIPWQLTFTRNILIISGCFWINDNSNNENIKISTWKKWLIFIFAGISLSLAGFTFKGTVFNKVKIHEGEQIDKSLLKDFKYKISKGKSIVFLFNPDCGHCWNSTENIKYIKNIPEYSNTFAITNESEALSGYIDKMKPNFEILIYPTNELFEKVKEYPVLLLINNGKVIKVFKSDNIPCGQILQHIEDLEKGKTN